MAGHRFRTGSSGPFLLLPCLGEELDGTTLAGKESMSTPLEASWELAWLVLDFERRYPPEDGSGRLVSASLIPTNRKGLARSYRYSTAPLTSTRRNGGAVVLSVLLPLGGRL